MNQENVDIKTPEYVSIQFKLAGLGSRAAALIIDQLILMLINILIIVVLYFVTNNNPFLPFWTEVGSLALAIAIIAIFLINWGYFFVLEFFAGGKTLGKRAMGIRVIQENGHSITLLSSFIRNLLRIIDSLPASNLLGMLMIFFHSKHKRIGDIVAGTIVVHERKAKRKKKLSPIEKEVERRGITKESLTIEEWTLKSLEQKDWNLVKTYTNRFLQMPIHERKELTIKIAQILFPKIGFEMDGKSDEEVENILLALYLILKDEWEYEL